MTRFRRGEGVFRICLPLLSGKFVILCLLSLPDWILACLACLRRASNGCMHLFMCCRALNGCMHFIHVLNGL